MAVQPQGFAWASAAQFGAGVLSSLFSGSASRSVARAENRTRKAQNAARHARNSLSATIKGINDANTMRAAGKNFNAAMVNAQRMADSFTSGNFEAGIRGAEVAGQLAARSALIGVAGSANRAAEYSQALQRGRAVQSALSNQDKALFDAQEQASSIVGNAFMSLDRSRNYQQMDLSSSSGTSFFSSLLNGVASNTGALNTMLGSLSNLTGPATGVEINPVSRSSVIGNDLGTLNAESGGTGAVAYPVSTPWITGTPLNSLPVVQFKSQVKGI